jgi:hypothetical protein
LKQKDLSKHLELLKLKEESFLSFLKAKFPVFHNSNFFYRDLQYGIKSFMELKDIIITYTEADKLAKILSEYFEEKSIFIRVNNSGWKVNYPAFATTEPGDPF